MKGRLIGYRAVVRYSNESKEIIVDPGDIIRPEEFKYLVPYVEQDKFEPVYESDLSKEGIDDPRVKDSFPVGR